MGREDWGGKEEPFWRKASSSAIDARKTRRLVNGHRPLRGRHPVALPSPDPTPPPPQTFVRVGVGAGGLESRFFRVRPPVWKKVKRQGFPPRHLTIGKRFFGGCGEGIRGREHTARLQRWDRNLPAQGNGCGTEKGRLTGWHPVKGERKSRKNVAGEGQRKPLLTRLFSRRNRRGDKRLHVG